MILGFFCYSEFKKSTVIDLNVTGVPFYSPDTTSGDPTINFNISWSMTIGKRIILLLHLYHCRK